MLVHDEVIAAAPEDVYRLVVDLESAPRWLPSHLHAEVTPTDEPGVDVVRRWVVDGGAVRSWSVRRRCDPGALTVVFEHVKPPLLTGRWRFLPVAGGTRVEVTHEVVGPEEAVARVDANVPRQLAGYRTVAEYGPQRDGFVVETRVSTVVVCGVVEARRQVLAGLRSAVHVVLDCGDVVAKYLEVPEWAIARCGRWSFEQGPDGVVVSRVETTTLKP